jgi:hypothetical protein
MNSVLFFEVLRNNGLLKNSEYSNLLQFVFRIDEAIDKKTYESANDALNLIRYKIKPGLIYVLTFYSDELSQLRFNAPFSINTQFNFDFPPKPDLMDNLAQFQTLSDYEIQQLFFAVSSSYLVSMYNIGRSNYLYHLNLLKQIKLLLKQGEKLETAKIKALERFVLKGLSAIFKVENYNKIVSLLKIQPTRGRRAWLLAQYIRMYLPRDMFRLSLFVDDISFWSFYFGRIKDNVFQYQSQGFDMNGLNSNRLSNEFQTIESHNELNSHFHSPKMIESRLASLTVVRRMYYSIAAIRHYETHLENSINLMVEPQEAADYFFNYPIQPDLDTKKITELLSLLPNLPAVELISKNQFESDKLIIGNRKDELLPLLRAVINSDGDNRPVYFVYLFGFIELQILGVDQLPFNIGHYEYESDRLMQDVKKLEFLFGNPNLFEVLSLLYESSVSGIVTKETVIT